MATKEKIAGEKKFTLWMPAEVHKRIKSRAALRETTIQKYLLTLIENDYDNELEFEELDEDDIRDIEQGRKEYETGNFKTSEQVKEDLPCQ